MSEQEILTIESLLEYLGGCGIFQVLIVIFLHGAIATSPWSMIFMAYGNYNPGWTCMDSELNLTTDTSSSLEYSLGNITQKGDDVTSCKVYEGCKDIVFNTASKTIVTEWNLACDKKWITSLMISLQMVGVLVGALLAGQLNLVIGRKKMQYGTLALHAIFNVIASFSTNWPMFTVLRFCLGVSSGSLMLCAFVYPMEFVTNRWRGVVAALPFSTTGSMSFSLAAMFLRDWRHLHRLTALLTGLFILPVFWSPDSMRWLALKNKIEEAEEVGLKIAKTNRQPPASMEVISTVAEKEREIEESQPRFTFLDLYRHGLLKCTFVLALALFTNTVVYYTFIFDVQSLSGNIFANLIIFSAISIIGLPFVPLFTNTVGRKRGIVFLMALAAVGCAIMLGMNFVTSSTIDKGLARLILVILVTIFIDAEWAILQLYCVELYPTVLRSLSYSHGSSIARVGGMLAPFLIPRSEDTVYISQLVMLVLIASSCLGIFFLPETKGKHLEESIDLKGVEATKQGGNGPDHLLA